MTHIEELRQAMAACIDALDKQRHNELTSAPDLVQEESNKQARHYAAALIVHLVEMLRTYP